MCVVIRMENVTSTNAISFICREEVRFFMDASFRQLAAFTRIMIFIFLQQQQQQQQTE